MEQKTAPQSADYTHSISQTQGLLSPTSHERKMRHFEWPIQYAYLIYDLSSPVFSDSEVETVFSPPKVLETPPTPSITASMTSYSSRKSQTLPGNGWGTFLSSRMEHITHRDPSLKPTGICVGEFNSASVAHPCRVHGIGQVFHGWEDHPSVKHFKEMIASTPVIKPSSNGPAQILKVYLDEYGEGRDPLEFNWVLKFLLLPKSASRPSDSYSRWYGMQDWQDLCKPKVSFRQASDFKPVALVCVRRESFVRKEALSEKLIQFGKLFSVEVMVVSSLG